MTKPAKKIQIGFEYLYRPLFGSSEAKDIYAGERVVALRPANKHETERAGFYLVATLDGRRKDFASAGSLHELLEINDS